jgi:hypothetical protein
MIQLTADICPSLLDLIATGEAPIDGVEVGSWFTPRQIRSYRSALPNLPFTFHAAGLITGIGILPGVTKLIRQSTEAAGSPWVSAHISLWLPGMLWLMHRYQVRLPRPDPVLAERLFTWQALRLVRSFSIPILLENNDPVPFNGYEFEVEPQRIARIIAKTGCSLLLDTAHARVSARALDMDLCDYVGFLPLEQVVQIHITSPRELNGRLVDAHQPLLDEDYEVLEFLLARTHPKMVTLEYIREREPLKEMLYQLRGILSLANKSKDSAR